MRFAFKKAPVGLYKKFINLKLESLVRVVKTQNNEIQKNHSNNIESNFFFLNKIKAEFVSNLALSILITNFVGGTGFG